MSNWNGFQFHRFSDDTPEEDIDIIEIQYVQEVTNPLEIIGTYLDTAKQIHSEGELFTLLAEFWNEAYKTGYKDCKLESVLENIDLLNNFDEVMFVNQSGEYDEEE